MVEEFFKTLHFTKILPKFSFTFQIHFFKSAHHTTPTPKGTTYPFRRVLTLYTQLYILPETNI